MGKVEHEDFLGTASQGFNPNPTLLSLTFIHLISCKKFREINVTLKKGSAKIKDAKFSDLYKTFF